jgi:F0F1-type ATP synthase assembly protein I
VIHTHRHPRVVSPAEAAVGSDDRGKGAGNGVGWSEMLGVGATAAGAIAAGILLGLLVDHLLGTLPIFLFVGLLLGIAGSVWYLVLKFRSYLS